ncbi:glycosyltransferase family 2 protein [Pedobacter aquatilis]|uniref:glycosyltransferase family 2 protein n=1 Tax=Pedobacter aquatilis TaxID=351343 RepID=UPI00292F45E7|nr:glycosyltransferase family 2 protein [Pedobacter aquatilis]
MPAVKVFIPTYKRNSSLKRAINSLLMQTFDNWICEIHNDDPADMLLADYVNQLNDSRFTYIKHKKNLGPVVTFNLMYQSTDATYITLLEDDNWWEPTFLKEMTKLLDEYPHVEMAWSNMHLWKENIDGNSESLNETIWPYSKEKLELIEFGDIKQSYGALHSNGAMLIRNNNLQKYILPTDIRFDFVEPFRERHFNYPIILNNKPLANYNFTRSTNRRTNLDGLYEHYIILLSSFFKIVEPTTNLAKSLWNLTRNEKVRSTNRLLYTGLLYKNCRFLLKHAKINDWLFFILYNLKHPTIFIKCFKFKRRNGHLWRYLTEGINLIPKGND